ncbi:MAG: hypothetical protein IIA67_01395 [Planctomycetes bacterium]|nr:hypothetical protein [Planctomycetota bacterium]
MRCDELESRINVLLDERRQPHADGDVADHARECDACADVLAGYQQALDAVGRATPLEMDGDPTAQIVAQVQWAARRRRRFWTTLVPLAVAASLLIALAPVIKMRLDQRDVELVSKSSSPPDESSEKTSADKPAADDAVLPAAAADEPKGANIVRLAFEVNEVLVDLLRARRGGSQQPDAGGPSQREWLRKMSDRLKPLADTMAAALVAMGRTLPNTGGAERPSS